MAGREIEEVVISGRGRVKIATVALRGTIVDDASNPNPLRGGSKEISARGFEKLADRILSDRNIYGVILKINSPGGMATASEDLYASLKEVKTRMPIVTYVEGLCASGGYMASVASDFIVAPPSALVGSIGVILQHIDISEGLKKIGVKAEAIKTSDFKGAGSPYESLSEETRAYLQDIVDASFARFKNIVLENREPITDTTEAFSAKVFHAQKALELGLIDAIGNFETAKNAIQQLILHTHPELHRETVCWIEFKRRSSFLEQKLGGLTGMMHNPLLAHLEILQSMHQPGLWYIWRP